MTSRLGFYYYKPRNIHKALAFETALFDTFNFKDSALVLFWISKRCIVVGRHQNPWLECSIRNARRNNVAIARRSSGGGTVYHDEGNLNISFLTNRSKYDKKLNMSLIAESVNELADINCFVGKRDDIFMPNDLKISGSSSRLLRDKAYHHCTLLFDADLANLRGLLKSDLEIKTNATQSVSSAVGNSGINPEDVIAKICNLYSRQLGVKAGNFMVVEEGKENTFVEYFDRNFELYSSYQWIYGKTPNFSIEKNIDITGYDNCRFSILLKDGTIDSVNIDGVPDKSYSDILTDKITKILCGTFLVPMMLDEKIAQLYLDFSCNSSNCMLYKNILDILSSIFSKI